MKIFLCLFLSDYVYSLNWNSWHFTLIWLTGARHFFSIVQKNVQCSMLNFQLFFVLLHVLDELINNKQKFKMTDKELVQLCKLGESESLPKRPTKSWILLPNRMKMTTQRTSELPKRWHIQNMANSPQLKIPAVKWSDLTTLGLIVPNTIHLMSRCHHKTAPVGAEFALYP